jgi:hypothetical protein
MFARGGEVHAVAGALNLDETLGAATGRANLVTERRTGPPRTSLAAEWTHHNAYYCIAS